MLEFLIYVKLEHDSKRSGDLLKLLLIPGESKYSEDKEEYEYGSVVKQLANKMVSVLWDGDSNPLASTHKHLSFADKEEQETVLQAVSNAESRVHMAKILLTTTTRKREESDPTLFYYSLALIETKGNANEAATLEPHRSLSAVASALRADETEDMRHRYTSADFPDRYPKSFFDALLKDDWRKWVEAYRKEWGTWDLTNSYKEEKFENMKKGSILTKLYELIEVKKDGTYKVRPVLAGETMEKGLDYGTTFARTASSDMIRFIVSFNVSVMNSPLWAADVSCAFLQAKNDRPVYVYKPSWYEFIYDDWDALAQLRMRLLNHVKAHGKSALKRMSQTRGRVETVLECLSAVYGNPAATRLWSLKNDEYLSQKCKLKKSIVEPCLYYMTEMNSNKSKRSSTVVTAIMLVGVHVDDLLISGTEKLKKEFRARYSNACGDLVKWQIPAEEFTSMKIKQDLDRHYCELTQPKYWELAGRRFEKYLPAQYCARLPVAAKRKN